jgi:Protein of unknown function (DUF2490)
MVSAGVRAGLLTGLLTGLAATDTVAQANLQLWGNLTFGWLRTPRLTYEVDFEPKVLVKKPEGDPSWRNVDVTPSVEYAAKKWLDLVGEVATGYTKQTDDVNSWEVSPRLGLRAHLFSRDVLTRAPHIRELPPARRIVVRDLLRVESRNLFYVGAGSGSDSSVRFRNRLELLAPLNRERLTDDGARYLLADWEWFVPLGEPDERFANKQRIRAGFGYRRSLAWRFEALYIWTRSRNTIEDGFKTSDNIIDIRLKRVF